MNIKPQIPRGWDIQAVWSTYRNMRYKLQLLTHITAVNPEVFMIHESAYQFFKDKESFGIIFVHRFKYIPA